MTVGNTHYLEAIFSSIPTNECIINARNLTFIYVIIISHQDNSMKKVQLLFLFIWGNEAQIV
jgi:hypothetical protein